MKLSAWVISYFGNDKETQKKRKEAHTKQMEWLMSLDIPITVLAQEYEKEEYFSGVDYVTSDRMWPAQARNILLERFYKGDSRFGIFADNDSILDPRFEGIDNIKALDDLPGVDLFVPVDPRLRPFNKDQRDNKDLYANFLCFNRHLGITGKIMFIRNVGDVFFDVTFQPGEDADFALQMGYAGYGVYRCNNLVLRELVSTSTLPVTWLGEEGRSGYKAKLATKWGDRGVVLVSGKLSRRIFLDQYFKGPANLQFLKPGVNIPQPTALF